MRSRKLNRLKNYDYSKGGYYFVTICTKNREDWFGKVESGVMILNRYGEIAKDCLVKIPIHFQGVGIDEFSVMPNHVHGILTIEEDIVGNAYMRSLHGALQIRTKMLLSKVIQQYKASVTRGISSLQGAAHFQWQKSFYDHVIRNEISLNNLREYVMYNPMKWELDIENRNGSSRHNRCVDYYDEITGSSRERIYAFPTPFNNYRR